MTVFLDLHLVQNDMIPSHTIANWEDLGIELGIESGERQQIKNTVVPEDVVVNCKAILTKWEQECGKTGELIRAMKACKLNSYAAVVQKGTITS